MKREISLNNIIDRRFYNNNNGEWEIMTEAKAEELIPKFKEFFLSYCRKGSKMYNAISRVDFSTLETCGIFGRITYCEEDDAVYYCAGQDYRAEINRLKQLITSR